MGDDDDDETAALRSNGVVFVAQHRAQQRAWPLRSAPVLVCSLFATAVLVSWSPWPRAPAMTTEAASPLELELSAAPSTNKTLDAWMMDDDRDRPVVTLADERYGPSAPEFSENRQRAWRALVKARAGFVFKERKASLAADAQRIRSQGGLNPLLDQTYAVLTDAADQAHADFCVLLNGTTPQLKYHEPEWTTANGGDSAAMERHYQQYRAFLADYYELPHGMPPMLNDGSRRNLQAVFARAIVKKRLVLGFMGSSMMSGQDNCHAWIYSETIKRQFARVLQPFNVNVVVRNMGQGEDGFDMVACLPWLALTLLGFFRTHSCCARQTRWATTWTFLPCGARALA